MADRGRPRMCGRAPSRNLDGMPHFDYDAVLFDLDGVLTSTTPLHAACWKQAFDEFLTEPFDIERDYLTHVDGKPRHEGVRDLLLSRGIEPAPELVNSIAERKQALVAQALESGGVDAFPGSVRWVEQAARRRRVHRRRVGQRRLRRRAARRRHRAAVRRQGRRRRRQAARPARQAGARRVPRGGLRPRRAARAQHRRRGRAGGRGRRSSGDFGLDIAHAMRHYNRVTGDLEFLLERGAEVLVETARFWIELGFLSERRGGRFCINGVTRPTSTRRSSTTTPTRT